MRLHRAEWGNATAQQLMQGDGECCTLVGVDRGGLRCHSVRTALSAVRHGSRRGGEVGVSVRQQLVTSWSGQRRRAWWACDDVRHVPYSHVTRLTV